MEPSRHIYTSSTRKVLVESELNEKLIANGLKGYYSLYSTIYRNKIKNLPCIPKNIDDVNIPYEYSNISGKKFLLCDDGETNKILAFGTEEFFKLLCESSEIYADGTFKSVPSIFSQLYTIHIMIKDVMVPVLYILLPNKNLNTYVRMFRLIQDIAIRLQLNSSPKKFTIDFEAAVITAIQALFPLAEINGCLFHFSQCIWSKVQNLGLRRD